MTLWTILSGVLGLVIGYWIGWRRGYIAGGDFVVKGTVQQINDLARRLARGEETT